MVSSDRNMPDSFDGFRSLWPGADLRGRIRGICIHPPAIFKNVFDVYSFSKFQRFLFDSNKPYALSTHKQKCANKMHHIWRSTQI